MLNHLIKRQIQEWSVNFRFTDYSWNIYIIVRNVWFMTWTWKRWKTYIFSDEKSIERRKGGRQWVFWTSHQKWQKEFALSKIKEKDISVMIWRAIWAGERSDLVIMKRDEKSKREILSSLILVYSEGSDFTVLTVRSYFHAEQRLNSYSRENRYLIR